MSTSQSWPHRTPRYRQGRITLERKWFVPHVVFTHWRAEWKVSCLDMGIKVSLSWKAFIVLHLVAHMKSDRNSLVRNEKRELKKRSIPCSSLTSTRPSVKWVLMLVLETYRKGRTQIPLPGIRKVSREAKHLYFWCPPWDLVSENICVVVNGKRLLILCQLRNE